MRYEDFLPQAVPPDTINDWSRHSGAGRTRQHTIPFKERKYYEDDCMVCYKAKLAFNNDPLGEIIDRVVGTPEQKYCRPKPFAKCQPPPPPQEEGPPRGYCIPDWVRVLPPGIYYFTFGSFYRSVVTYDYRERSFFQETRTRAVSVTFENADSWQNRQTRTAGINTYSAKRQPTETPQISTTNFGGLGRKPTIFQLFQFTYSGFTRSTQRDPDTDSIIDTVPQCEEYLKYHTRGELQVLTKSPQYDASGKQVGEISVDESRYMYISGVWTEGGMPLGVDKDKCPPDGKKPPIPWKPPEQPRSPITIYKDDDMCCEDTIYYLENIARAMQNLSKSQEKISLLVDRAYVNLNKVSDNLNKLSERVEKLEKEKIDKIKDKIGDPIDIEIIDSELDKQGGQIRSVKPSTLFELGGLATNRTEIANSVIGIAQFPIPYDKEELKKALQAINSSGTVEEIMEVLKPFNLPLIDNAGIDQFLFGLLPQDWQDKYKQAEDAVKGVYNAGFNLFKNKAGELVSKQIEQMEAKEKITSIAELLVKIYDSNSDGTLSKAEILNGGSGGEDDEKEGDGFPIILPAEQIPGDNDVAIEDVPQALQSLCIGLLNHFQVSAYSFDMLLKLLIDTSEIKGVLYQNRATIKDIQNYLGYGTKEEALEIEQQINLSLKKDIEKSANNQEDLSAMKEFDGDKNFDKFLEKSKVFTTYHKWIGQQSLDARLDTIEATLSQGRAIADTPAI